MSGDVFGKERFEDWESVTWCTVDAQRFVMTIRK
jgi:hypothetical protein